MNFKQLHYFVQVARHGSLSHAATALRMGQPALSRHIRALEVDLRRALFHRNGRGVVLTDAGEHFLSYAQSALRQLESARASVAGADGEVEGRVTVGLPASVARALTLPLVRAFQLRFSRARIAITEGLSAALQEQVLSGRLDLAVLHNPAPSALLMIEPLLEESFLLLSPDSEASSFARQSTTNLDELARLRLIAPPNQHSMRTKIEAYAAGLGLVLDVALEIEAIPDIPLLVQAGCGHAVVPRSLLWAGLPGGVQVRRLVRPNIRSQMSLVSSSRRLPKLLTDGTESMLRELLLQAAEPKKELPRRA